MKKKYNIQTAPHMAARPAPPAAASPGPVSYTNAPEGGGEAGAEAEGGEEEEKTVSPSLNVAALRSRLARLKKH